MTDIATNLNTIDGSLSDIKTAIVNKGGTVSGNITTFATAIDNIPSGGGTPSGTTDVPLTRVTDDNNNEIGTWFCNFEDANGTVYKVVLLDAQYRLANVKYSSTDQAVTDLPIYYSLKTANVWTAKETATFNTQKILDWCASGGYTSNSCSHCRSKSFTINGTTYYGQLPNMMELLYLAKHYNEFDALDTTASSYTSVNFNDDRDIWSSSQMNAYLAWSVTSNGNASFSNKTYNYFIACPVLEIPLS